MKFRIMALYVRDYADEFDTHGFKIFESISEFEDWKSRLQEGFAKYKTAEIYFGTNEYHQFDSYEDYWRDIKIHYLDANLAASMEFLFSGKEWGVFPDPSEYWEE